MDCKCKTITFENSLFCFNYGDTPTNRRIWKKRGIKKIRCNNCMKPLKIKKNG